MNVVFLNKAPSAAQGEIFIGGSKSESNRLLILNKLFGNKIKIHNLSDSEDTRLLQNALESEAAEIDIHHAGTAMRFLTAYFSIQEGKEVILTGSERMKQRPVGVLVDALKTIGAEISYLEKEGFPPLHIKGKKIIKNSIELNADISSQFVTALMLIAPKLEKGLTIRLNGKITSLPYLTMTLQMLDRAGVKAELKDNTIRISPVHELDRQEITVESDWSSASYYYSVAAITSSPEIKLNSFYSKSLQGDSKVMEIYREFFGVKTEFAGNHIILRKKTSNILTPYGIDLNLNSTPDIAQTIAVTCAALKLKCKLTGLETLKIKETDRLSALKNELEKVGAIARITNDSLEITGFKKASEVPLIRTYNDHRMAMSFAPLRFLTDLKIENPDVVQKSYPEFWQDLEKLIKVRA